MSIRRRAASGVVRAAALFTVASALLGACGADSATTARDGDSGGEAGDTGAEPAAGGSPGLGGAPGSGTLAGEAGMPGRAGSGLGGGSGQAGESASDAGAAGAGSATAAEGGGAGAPPDLAPLVTVVGGDLVLDCGVAFVDPGATATDAEDGSLVVAVEGADEVDTAAPGKFVIDYSAQDSASQVATGQRTIFVCGPGCGELGKELIDLSSWEVIQYEQASQADANWVVAPDGLSVQQTVNADASILLSDFDTGDLAIEGSWTMQSSSDDDFVGFVFGYKDRGHFSLFDWKGGTQTYLGAQALVGMALKLVDMPDSAPEPIQLTVADLWSSTGTANVTPLMDGGAPLRNSIDWLENQPYGFALESHAGSFSVTIKQGDVVLASWSVRDEAYANGKFGFYNFSQAPVSYSSFTRRVTPPECSTVD